MEITSFYPMIATTDFEATKAAYEALGFKQAHDIGLPNTDYHVIVMKNDKGFRLGIFAGPDFKPGMPNTYTWMNVRDFDATVALLKEHGFTAFTPKRELDFLKVVSMKAPDGHILVVVYHKRKNDWE